MLCRHSAAWSAPPGAAATRQRTLRVPYAGQEGLQERAGPGDANGSDTAAWCPLVRGRTLKPEER
jgi:hypothetical protein